MISWTQPAKEEIDNYFKTVRASLLATGADPVEVIDDLQRHIQEEVQSSRLQTVTREDVRRIVGRLGLPDNAYAGANGRAVLEKEPDALPPVPGKTERTVKKPGTWLFIFGVIFPLLVLLLELITHFCGSVFFDPIPTYGHVLLAAFVPVSNLIVFHAIRSRRTERWRRLAWMSGVASGVALFYSVRYSVMLVPALFAMLLFGLGLLPMAPLFSLIATIRTRTFLKQFLPEGSSLPPLLPALLIGAGLVFALDVPVLLTHLGLQMADSDSSSSRVRGIQLLRAVGHNKTMLRVCYGQDNGSGPIDLYRAMLGRNVSSEEAKSIYYRVNGRPFNSVAPPASFTSLGRYQALDRELAWDNDQGGDTVAGRVKGLSLSNSRIDGFFDAEGSAAYLEWTMEFKNVSSLQREARAQIALPSGAVVSRLTLWVNGEEREAAFAGCGEVRQAYQRVVVQRHDPVLVTYAGPDHVMMQCFPVPTNGTMKVRLGITTPLELLDPSHGAVPVPYFVERNFKLREGFAHNLWLESKAPIEFATKDLPAIRDANGKFQIRGGLSDSNLSRFGGTVRVSLPPSIKDTWATDKRQPGYIVRQSIAEVQAPKINKAFVVLDGSIVMSRFQQEVAEAFKTLPGHMEVTLFIPHDEGVEVISASRDEVSREKMTRHLRELHLSGGQDNVTALVKAWDAAAEGAGSIVLWVHGSQPMVSPSLEQLKQRLDWHGQSVALLDFPIEAGPNRVFEKMDPKTSIRTIARLGSVKDDLARLFSTWLEGSKRCQVTRTHEPEKSAGDLTKVQKASDHIVRLWAHSQALQHISNRKATEAVGLAALYQLVTPVSGAVVLENKTQYQQAELTPVDPATVPIVPEPKVYVLAGLCLMLALYQRRRKLRRSA